MRDDAVITAGQAVPHLIKRNQPSDPTAWIKALM